MTGGFPSYPGSSDAFRTIKLWFEQQIENAKQDQISGFAECSERGTIRGEKAHSRHCAMFEALQMFLSEFGTFTDAQRPADCGDPFLWICLVPGKWEPENIRAWTRDPDRAAAFIDQGLDMIPLFRGSAVSSTASGSAAK